ncbi:hypothetical protein AKJ47_02705, partial [candidate division MSBL1 archaeon SCGC-AAA261G05]
ALAHLLPESYVPPEEIRKLRQKLYHRTCLVRERTKFKNKIHAELAKQGIEFDESPWTKKGKQKLNELKIDEINDYLAMIKALNERINRLSRELKQEARESEEANLLITIPGVGYFSALSILAEIGNIDRFSNPEKLCSYAGIIPSTRQSGHITRRGSITKEGRRCLRWVLVECIWSHLTHTSGTRLTRFFRRIAKRRGKKVAVVATARKLLVAVYWMLKRGEEYHP